MEKVFIAGKERELVKPQGLAASRAVIKAVVKLSSDVSGEAELEDALKSLANTAKAEENLEKLDPLIAVFFQYGLNPAPRDDEIMPADYIASLEVIGKWIPLLELDRSFRPGDAANEVGAGVRRSRASGSGDDVGGVERRPVGRVPDRQSRLLPTDRGGQPVQP